MRMMPLISIAAMAAFVMIVLWWAELLPGQGDEE